MKDIMNADKVSVDEHPETNLMREGKDFDTKARTDVLIQDAAKKSGKSYDTGCLDKANDMSLYNTSGK